MHVTQKTRRIVWARSGSTCAICKKFLVMETAEPQFVSLIGEVAHILARRDGGPRSDLNLPEAGRNTEENLFLLCLDHHTLIDDHPENYPPDKLQTIRKEHIAWVKAKFAAGEPWSTNLQNFFYINLPRTLMLAELHGVKAEDPYVYFVSDISNLEGNYLSFIRAMQPVIESLHPNATPLSESALDASSVGTVVCFNGRFYTKNLSNALMGKWHGFTGDLSKDPHIYLKKNELKVIFPLEPRWLTTTTAGVHLSSGSGHFAGIGIINSAPNSDGLIYASLLLLGHPKQ